MMERFSFGRNWRSFLDNEFDQIRFEYAKKSITDFLNVVDLSEKKFVDVGCGSGIYSLAASELGAAKVVSCDIDEDSVQCCGNLRDKQQTDTWQVKKGSVLDNDFLQSLGKFDLVYSFGVIHHTGNMWQAMDNLSKLTDINGLVYIAIYNKIDGFGFFEDGRFGSNSFWLWFKKKYTSIPSEFQWIVDRFAFSIYIFLALCAFKNPLKLLTEYRARRGMSLFYDIRDWFGGYPYEYANTEEIFSFFKKRGFIMENIKCNPGFMCSEYLFRKI